MDAFVKQAAGMGMPAVMLLVILSTTGRTGAEGVKATLERTGGLIPAAVLFGVVATATGFIARYGLEVLLVAIYQQRRENGERRSNLFWEIKLLPIPVGLRLRLYEAIGV